MHDRTRLKIYKQCILYPLHITQNEKRNFECMQLYNLCTDLNQNDYKVCEYLKDFLSMYKLNVKF